MTTTNVQTMQALELANSVRFYRADIKNWLHACPRLKGLEAAADLITVPDPNLRTMQIVELLASCHFMGARRAERILREGGLSSTKTVGALTARQRRVLAEVLRGWAK